MITYEWAIELTENPWQDTDGEIIADIIDPFHGDSLADFQRTKWLDEPPESGYHYRLCLIRLGGDEDSGELSRDYAYFEGGEFPTEFDNGLKVPEKYLREVKRNLEWCKQFEEPEGIADNPPESIIR